MKHMAYCCQRFCLWLTAGIGGILSVMTIFGMIIYCILYSNNAYAGSIVVMLLMALLTAVVLFLGWRKLGSCDRRITVVLFASLVLLQIGFLLFVSHPMAISDPARVQNEALLMAQKRHGQMNMKDAYFQRYPNNHFIVVVFYYFYKWLYFMGIHKVWVPTVLLNILCLDGGIILSWLTAKNWKGLPAANLLLGLFILCPTTYVWLTTVYTNTLSFPFVMAIIYLCRHLQNNDGKKRYPVLLGMVMAVGYWVRPTTIIPIIAVVIYGILCIVRNRQKFLQKQYLWKTLIVVAVFVCCFAGCGRLVDRHVDQDKLTGQFPIEHWIMMGLNQESAGGFSRSDEAYTLSYATKAEKRAADVQRIRQRLSRMGVSGVGVQAAVKMFSVWALSDDDCFRKAEYASDFPGLYRYFMGDDNDWYLLFMQAFRFLTFVFLTMSILGQLRKKEIDESFIISLTFLGAVLFFILWEANRKYNVCFMGIYLLLMTDGIILFYHRFLLAGLERLLQRAGTRKLTMGLAAVMSVIMIFTIFIQQSIIGKMPSAKVNTIYHCRNNPDSVPVDEVKNIRKSVSEKPVLFEQTIQQGRMTLKGEKQRIYINFAVKGNEATSKDVQGRMEKALTKKIIKNGKIKKILRKKGKDKKRKSTKKEYCVEVIALDTREKIYKRKVGADQLTESGKLVLRLPKAARNTKKGYVIRLRHYGKKYHMVPKVSRFPDLNPYPYGSLYVNGRKSSYDLSMSIVQKKIL